MKRWQHDAVDSARVDQWLWAIRLFKTRTAATDACRSGHVRINGSPAKSAAKVRRGDRVKARVHSRDRVFQVERVVDKRLGAAQAAECAIDLSPPPTAREQTVFVRAPGSGRPTKRDRRNLERLRR
jgi:ribosome-associated heat shock protein Hsp15